MAIYSCNISNVSRAGGSNTCATMSYITGLKIKCERTGDTYNYGRAQRVVDVAAHLPAVAPDAWRDPAKLANAIESYEQAANARPAKKLMVALPREMTLDQHKQVVSDMCARINKLGYACVAAIHYDADGNNPHAHIVIANRPINSKGEFVNAKSRKEYVLDDNGERVPQIDKSTGQQKIGRRNEKLWKRKTVKVNPLDQRDTLLDLRKQWANICNAQLAPENQIDHRSHEERGIEQLPTVHEGYTARAIESRGGTDPKCALNRDIRAFNRDYLAAVLDLAKLQKRAQELKQLIAQRELKQAARAEKVEKAKDAGQKAMDAASRGASAAKDAAGNQWHKFNHWRKTKVAPALTAAIAPEDIAPAKDERWNSLMQSRADERRWHELDNKLSADLSRYRAMAKDPARADERRWWLYKHKDEIVSNISEMDDIAKRSGHYDKWITDDIGRQFWIKRFDFLADDTPQTPPSEPAQVQQTPTPAPTESKQQPTQQRQRIMPDPHTHKTVASLTKACVERRQAQREQQEEYSLDDILDGLEHTADVVNREYEQQHPQTRSHSHGLGR